MFQKKQNTLSNRKFYKKITDIYATSLSYDPSAKATKKIVSSYLDMVELQAKIHILMPMED